MTCHPNRLLGKLSTIAMLAVLVTCPVQSQNERRDDLVAEIKQHATWDPAQFLLDKLRKHRIVMVADFEHGVSLYHQAVMKSIDLWLTAWENSASSNTKPILPANLFLVLEIDSVDASKLNNYFSTGNLLETFTPSMFAGNFTTAFFEFYRELRVLHTRIQAFNRDKTGVSRISLAVIGPEKVIDPSTWTPQWSDQFFAYERDEYASSKIIAALDSVPDSQALVFYGGMHFERRKVPKLGQNQGIGYFMAHYLTEHYRSTGGVYTCGQFPVPSITWIDDAIRKVGKTFAIDHSSFRGVAISPDASIMPVDGAIYYSTAPHQSQLVSTILSENLVDLVLAHIHDYTDVSKPLKARNLENSIRYLCSVRPQAYRASDIATKPAVDSTVAAWESWRRSVKLNLVEDLSGMAYFARALSQMNSGNPSESAWLERSLRTLAGFKIWLPYDDPQQDRLNILSATLTKYRKPIVIENLIEILWIGSPAETKQALDILGIETGRKFMTAMEWTRWLDESHID